MTANDEPQGRDRPASDLAVRDDLTGLFNRRLLAGLFAQRWPGLIAEHGRVSVVMIDLDGFKDVNDTFGHLAGDVVLRATARILRRGFRNDDVIVRYGGDEFVVLLPGVGAVDAARLGERVREAMAGLGEDPEVRAAGIDASVSFSIGVASAPDDGDQPEAVLARADGRLFADKRRRHPLSDRRWDLVAVSALLAVGLWAGWTLSTTPRRGDRDAEALAMQRSPDLSAPASPEVEALLAEIADLRRQLAQRREAHAVSADAEQDRRAIEMLQGEIRDLEARLAARRAPATPETPAAAPAPRPPGAESALGAAPTEAPAVPAVRPTAVVRPTPQSAPEPVPTLAAAVLPVLEHYEPPRYPEIARRLRREADVDVRVVVDERGRVVSVGRIGPTAGYGFDEAARDAAFRARFKPGTVGGVPATMETTLTIRFRLGENP